MILKHLLVPKNTITLKLAINYLLDNCYFTLGSMHFYQLTGIPMGSDPGSFITNLFLYYYERRWLLEIIKKTVNAKGSISFKYFWFIDDLCIFNNDEFENNYNDIYANELELKKENDDPSKALFLDLSIEAHDRKFSTKLFNKRDAFPFYINRMPYLDNNIPSKTFYTSISSEIVRMARTTSELINMVTHANILLICMKKQGNECTRIISLLKKIFEKHFKVFHKFANTTDEFNKLLSLQLFVNMYM